MMPEWISSHDDRIKDYFCCFLKLSLKKNKFLELNVLFDEDEDDHVYMRLSLCIREIPSLSFSLFCRSAKLPINPKNLLRVIITWGNISQIHIQSLFLSRELENPR